MAGAKQHQMMVISTPRRWASTAALFIVSAPLIKIMCNQFDKGEYPDVRVESGSTA
jgi:hypothetical protein